LGPPKQHPQRLLDAPAILGRLLPAANGSFDVLVTADKSMHHQQRFEYLGAGVPTNRVKLVSLVCKRLFSPGHVFTVGVGLRLEPGSLTDVVVELGSRATSFGCEHPATDYALGNRSQQQHKVTMRFGCQWAASRRFVIAPFLATRTTHTCFAKYSQ